MLTSAKLRKSTSYRRGDPLRSPDLREAAEGLPYTECGLTQASTRLLRRTIGLALCLALLTSAGAAGAASRADEYLALRTSLGATSPRLSALKDSLPAYIGRTVELRGTVNGIAKCGESLAFILNCDGQSVVVKVPADPPACLANGNTIRALVKIGPESVASLSDLYLERAAYDYDVSAREKQLASKPKAKQTASAPQSRGERSSQASAPPWPLASRGGNPSLAARIREIYEPYRKAIARFNPRLSDQELDAITKSILAYSARYGIDPRLVVALILVESGFRLDATSPKGAMGLGQLMPSTARGLGVSNAYDPVQNIEGSVKLMRGHLEKYGDLSLALSAYNAGPGAVSKYNGVPPYRETQNYIRKVSQVYRAFCGY